MVYPWDILAIIGAILIPLMTFMITFMFRLRPFIKDTIKADMGDVMKELSSLKGEMKGYRDAQKLFIDLYKGKSNLTNPHLDKGILLEKLKNDTITREEAIYLQEILTAERNQAQQQNDFLKAIIIIGILALVAAAISRSS